jgi:hypothetical protein
MTCGRKLTFFVSKKKEGGVRKKLSLLSLNPLRTAPEGSTPTSRNQLPNWTAHTWKGRQVPDFFLLLSPAPLEIIASDFNVAVELIASTSRPSRGTNRTHPRKNYIFERKKKIALCFSLLSKQDKQFPKKVKPDSFEKI